tara:strand:- start:4670 stop:4843 length:174 start_codon:yes stop_codon:yes gene_type:complete
MSNNKNYFDKFIDDQLKRKRENVDRRHRHEVNPEQDKKRELLRLYRERVANLVRWKK